MFAPSSSSPRRSRAGAAQMERMLAVSSPTVLAYPAASSWQARSGAPRIPGLSIAQPLLLAPGGAGVSVGLIAGKLAEDGPGPLPARFLARLPRAPTGEVVDLMNSQAYRYPHVSLPGFDHDLTLYAIPNSMGTTLVACYAPTAATSAGDLRTCEQIAAKLTLQVEAQSYELLTPDAGYARLIGAAIGRADEVRRELRPAMRPGASLASLSTLATRLAAGLAGAAESLSTLQPPPAAGWAHTALTTALWRARDAYSALAAAAHSGIPARYAAARTLVDEAEANLSSALRSFALIGYA
ncbi:MAG: hypothetical protein ACHQDY_01290 [Solirubrobacterales bacterium]